MKKDNLREFVSANRDSFDDQQPGADILAKLNARLKLEHAVAPKSKIIRFQYWWAAAMLIMGIAYFTVFENNTSDKNTTAHNNEVTRKAPGIVTDQKALEPVQRSEWVALTEPGKKKPVKKRQTGSNVNSSAYPERRVRGSNIAAGDWAEDLKSESSSARLSAILKLGERSSLLPDRDLRILFTTMNSDASSNVRLAVLEVLKKYETQPLVKDFILQSVVKQDDPVVQMELLSSLSLHEAVKIKKQLLDLSQDPNHIDLVREQAYVVLFRSNISI
jgi:hypothetical protein